MNNPLTSKQTATDIILQLQNDCAWLTNLKHLKSAAISAANISLLACQSNYVKHTKQAVNFKPGELEQDLQAIEKYWLDVKAHILNHPLFNGAGDVETAVSFRA